MTKFESDVRTVNKPAEEAYAKYADMSNLGALREKLSDSNFLEMIADRVPADKLEMVKAQLEKMSFDADSVTIDTPVGALTLRIVEREEPKLVKLVAENSPVPANVWIQLVPEDEHTSKLRVTLGAELNIFIKGMVSKPLQQAADGLASVLSLV